MSRIGTNPMRRKKIDNQIDEVAVVITHLPNQSGYHEKRLEVVKASLLSMRMHAPEWLYIHVWDNGSCEELRDWLRDEFKPDALTLTHNIGKAYAQAALFNMYPEDAIIAYADDDMLYYPGWFDAQMKIYDTYPDCVVTGYPTRSAFRWGVKNTQRSLPSALPTKTTHNTMPDEWLKEYARSVGMKTVPDGIRKAKQISVSFNGVEAYLTSHHCQFISRAGDIAPLMEYSNLATRGEKQFDIDVDNAGILRLATIERYTRHMGNILDGDMRKHALEFGVIAEVPYYYEVVAGVSV